MKVLILYRPNSDHARPVEEFVHDFTRQHPGKVVELISLDTRDGAATATLYDVLNHPALLAVRDDGSVLQLWQGDQLPLMNEVAAYLNS